MRSSKEWAARTPLITVQRTMWTKFVNYHPKVRTENWHRHISSILSLSLIGVDIIMDPLNGEDSVRGYGLLKPLGRIIYFGRSPRISTIRSFSLWRRRIGAANVVASGENRSYLTALKTWYKCFSTDSLAILSNNKSIAGYHLGYLMKDLDSTNEIASSTITELFRLYNIGAIKPQIDSIFPFSKIGDAMQRMHLRQNVGKVLLRPDTGNGSEEPQQSAGQAE